MNSLGINKSKTKVVVAMSGGVDSSVISCTYERRGIQCNWYHLEAIR